MQQLGRASPRRATDSERKRRPAVILPKRRSKDPGIYLYVIPALVLALAAVGYPVVRVLLMAFQKVNQFGISTGWAGFGNFVGLWNSGFPGVIINTVIWTVGILVPTVVLSLLLASALATNIRWKAFFRSVILIPWAIPLAIVAMLSRLILQTSYGELNTALRDLGIVSHGIPWLATASTSLPIMLAIGIWVSIPFTTLTLLSGIYAIPGELVDAAVMDCPGAWSKFRYVTLPLIRNPLQLVVLINLAYIFNSFPIIWILTQGGPAEATATSTIFVYQLAFTDGNFGFAGAAALLSLCVLVIVAAAYIKLYRRSEGSLL